MARVELCCRFRANVATLDFQEILLTMEELQIFFSYLWTFFDIWNAFGILILVQWVLFCQSSWQFRARKCPSLDHELPTVATRMSALTTLESKEDPLNFSPVSKYIWEFYCVVDSSYHVETMAKSEFSMGSTIARHWLTVFRMIVRKDSPSAPGWGSKLSYPSPNNRQWDPLSWKQPEKDLGILRWEEKTDSKAIKFFNFHHYFLRLIDWLSNAQIEPCTLCLIDWLIGHSALFLIFMESSIIFSGKKVFCGICWE
jgi:hypothetical protein